MSFILDALKKSESARQRKNRPDSAHIPAAPGKASTPRWLLFIGVLLMVNVLVLLVVLLKPGQTGSETVLTTTTREREAASDAPKSFRELVTKAKRNQPPLGPAPDATQSMTNPAAIDTQTTGNKSATTAKLAAIPITIPSTVATGHKTFNEVRLNGSVQLPELHLDIHVYSEIPVDRFVFINMNKYQENATLSEGPLVAQIVPEGVILDYRGTRFLLPRE